MNFTSFITRVPGMFRTIQTILTCRLSAFYYTTLKQFNLLELPKSRIKSPSVSSRGGFLSCDVRGHCCLLTSFNFVHTICYSGHVIQGTNKHPTLQSLGMGRCIYNRSRTRLCSTNHFITCECYLTPKNIQYYTYIHTAIGPRSPSPKTDPPLL